MQQLEGSGTPVLYIGRTVLKGYTFRCQSRYTTPKKLRKKIEPFIYGDYITTLFCKNVLK
jgi:hypothetical protein